MTAAEERETISAMANYRGQRPHAMRFPDDLWAAAIAKARAEGTTVTGEVAAFLEEWTAGRKGPSVTEMTALHAAAGGECQPVADVEAVSSAGAIKRMIRDGYLERVPCVRLTRKGIARLTGTSR